MYIYMYMHTAWKGRGLLCICIYASVPRGLNNFNLTTCTIRCNFVVDNEHSFYRICTGMCMYTHIACTLIFFFFTARGETISKQSSGRA